MKEGLTRIAMILDRSGSMASIRDAMIEGVNSYIDGLRSVPGECKVFACQFDTGNYNNDPTWYEVLFDTDLANVPKLTQANYLPRNGTPLIDAMGLTIDNLGTELSALPDEFKPEKVIVVIITDGEENSSHIYGNQFDKGRIKRMVQRQQETYGWAFVFLGANQDAVLQATEYGINPAGAATYVASANAARVTSRAAVAFSNSIRDMKGPAYSNLASASAQSFTPDVKSAMMDETIPKWQPSNTSIGAVPQPTPTATIPEQNNKS